jgi:carbon-monoxide dehydrogenase medium subunit
VIPRFELQRPEHLEDALRILADGGDDAVPYAGGTELLQIMKMGLSKPKILVDIKRLPMLRGIVTTAELTAIGPAMTHAAIAEDRNLRGPAACIRDVAGRLANARVRSVGTIGGNLAFAEPHSDLAPLLLALDAVIELRSVRGQRAVALDNFVQGPFETVRRGDELITAIRYPARKLAWALDVKRIAFFERPAVSVVTRLATSDDELVDCAVVVGSVGDRPRRIAAAEAILNGTPRSSFDEGFQAAAAAAGEGCDASDDLNGSAEYKRHLVRVLTRRSLVDASAALLGRR